MSLVNIEYDDFIRVEESQLDRWRVHNGETWAHGFKSRGQALNFAKRVGGTFIGKCEVVDGVIAYSKVVSV